MDMRPCAELVSRRLDQLMELHCGMAYNTRSFNDGMAWKDMTGPLSALLSKGTSVPEDEGGYVFYPAHGERGDGPLGLASQSRRLPMSRSPSSPLMPVPENIHQLVAPNADNSSAVNLQGPIGAPSTTGEQLVERSSP